jgi:hypothetical protein
MGKMRKITGRTAEDEDEDAEVEYRWGLGEYRICEGAREI